MALSSYLDGFDHRDWQHVEAGTVRLAMVGLGWWTRERAIPAVEAADLCETTALVSGDREKAEAVADRTPTVDSVLTYEEFQDGIGTDAYDAVYISTPNARHLPFVDTAAAMGKDVLCEKPMEATVERAEAVVEAVAGADCRLMVGYRMQTEPLVRRARALVRDGVIGEPAHVAGHMSQRLLDIFPDHDQWRLDPDLAGPGTSVTDLGIYPINTARFVLDDDPESVVATARSEADGFERVPDERASFELTFEAGTLASCSASQHAHRSGRFEVVGTEGRLAIEPAFFGDPRRSLTVQRGGTTAEVTAEPVDQMLEEFEYFADRLLGGGDIRPDAEHGLVDMRTIEAVYEAAATDRRIRP